MEKFMDTIRILIVEDHTIVRSSLKALLSKMKYIDVVGEAEDGLEGIKKASALTPDIVLMDIRMPRMNGTDAIKKIVRQNPSINIITLTLHKDEEYVHMALSSGAMGYVLKDDPEDVLLFAIKCVNSGHFFLSPSICDCIIRGYLARPEKSESVTLLEELTERERQIIKLIAEGYKNREIADYLSVSNKTVEKHRANLMRKLDVHSASQITAFAIAHGIAGDVNNTNGQSLIN